MHIYSIGYEQRSLDDFCRVLQAAGVKIMLDVRLRAWSHRPEYRKTFLSQALANAGIDYVHHKEAGNPFRPQKGEPRDLEKCAALYDEYLRSHPEVIRDIQKFIRMGKVALFCYEGHRERCHRGIIIEQLTERLPRIKVVDL